MGGSGFSFLLAAQLRILGLLTFYIKNKAQMEQIQAAPSTGF